MDAGWNYTRELLTVLTFFKKLLTFFLATWRFRWIYINDVDIFNIVPDDDLGSLEVYHWSGQGYTHQSRSVLGQEFLTFQDRFGLQTMKTTTSRTEIINRCVDP